MSEPGEQIPLKQDETRFEEQVEHRFPLRPESLREQVDSADVVVLRNAASKLQGERRKLHPPNLIAGIHRLLYNEDEKRASTPQPRTLQEIPSASAAAARSGYFTEGVRRPQSYKEVKTDKELERAYELITQRAYHIFGQTEAFREAVENEELGDALAETFDYVTRIHTERVREEEAPPKKIGNEMVDIRVVADHMDLWVSTGKEHKRLQVALQGLKASPDAPFSPNIVPYPDEATAEELLPYRLEHPTEYQVREFNTIVRSIRRIENTRRGIRDISVAEHAKRPLSALEAAGDTVDPANRAKLLAKNEKHKALQITAKYVGHEDDEEWKPQEKDEIDVTDQAAALGGMRRGFNGLLRHLKEGVHLNLEKDPSENLPLLNGIDLRRGGVTPEGRPAATRTSTRVERLEDTTRETLEDIKTSEGKKKLVARSVKALVNWVPNATSMFSPLTWVPIAYDFGVKIRNSAKYRHGDKKAYHQRRNEDAEALERIANDQVSKD